MKYTNFEDYLICKHMQDEPCVLDDDLPDAFSEWLCDLEIEDWLQYGDEYAKIKGGE